MKDIFKIEDQIRLNFKHDLSISDLKNSYKSIITKYNNAKSGTEKLDALFQMASLNMAMSIRSQEVKRLKYKDYHENEESLYKDEGS